jgi:hypothetical protein
MDDDVIVDSNSPVVNASAIVKSETKTQTADVKKQGGGLGTALIVGGLGFVAYKVFGDN